MVGLGLRQACIRTLYELCAERRPANMNAGSVISVMECGVVEHTVTEALSRPFRLSSPPGSLLPSPSLLIP